MILSYLLIYPIKNYIIIRDTIVDLYPLCQLGTSAIWMVIMKDEERSIVGDLWMTLMVQVACTFEEDHNNYWEEEQEFPL